ncbi:plipastatin synthase subunit A-like [Amphiura filiformis]|uniref:plipastatin synthase subunit A-like n=1 Tax=Amphiura filiformis TaxID=82378 RepID=UPI003B20E323
MILKDLHEIIRGRESSNRSPSQHYSDYVNDEHIYNTSANHEDDKEFWDANLSTLPGDCNLAIQPPSENNHTNVVVYGAKENRREICPESVGEIRRYCNSIEATEFHYFLACTSLVLQRYLGVDDFFIAVPVTSRTYLFADADGMFTNTVMFRVRVQKNQTMKDYVRYIRNEWLKTQSHSRYPLDQVTGLLWKAHGRSMRSLCSVSFNCKAQSLPHNALRIGSKHAKMPLSIVFNEEASTYHLISEYADNLVDGGIVERLSDAVLRLCCVGFKINEVISKVEILSPTELRLLQSFSTSNDNAATCHQFVPVHREFENHALQDPTATAIFCEENYTSYGKLHTISTKIATFLRRNLSTEDLRRRSVVMALKKNQYAIACSLGIWKAGGHFLPVPPSNEACLNDIFERDTPVALIYDFHSAAVQALPPVTPMWKFQDMLESCEKECLIEEENIDTVVAGEDTAYIIRTSGSTGKPKQCRISHESLRILAEAWKVMYSMQNYEVCVLQWAPLSFDVFISDVVRALVCAQGKLVICPDSLRLEIPYVLSLIRDQQVTLIDTTPQFGSQIVEHAHEGDIQSIKFLTLAADVFHEHLYSQIKHRLKLDQRLFNVYGMTEATVYSSYFEPNEYDEVPKTRGGTIPIGKPLPGVTMQILDSTTLQLCPIGTVGELYISGNVIATGDVDVVQVNSVKALKTGDSVCWLPTGDIELMGRLNDVVKLRGFRISTTEIENKILTLIAGVKEARVVKMPNRDTDGTEFLCAYLVLDDDSQQSDSITYHQVCNKLRSAIPYYMIPDQIQIIPEVPLTPHGKVNKKALSKVLRSSAVLRDQSQQSVSKSDSAIVTILRECLAEALGLQHQHSVQADTTFMEQGAHSLILVRFWSLLAKRSITVKVTDLFSYPTICSLAAYLESNERGALGINEYPRSSIPYEITDNDDADIAITGIGMRLPGGITSLAEFWRVLKNGSDMINEFPQQRRQDVTNCIGLSSHDETFQGAFLSNIDQFDHDFFKIAPVEAKFMSPEQRLFLQVATEALAQGASLSAIRGADVGVFVGWCEVGYAKLRHPDTAICVSGLMPG